MMNYMVAAGISFSVRGAMRSLVLPIVWPIPIESQELEEFRKEYNFEDCVENLSSVDGPDVMPPDVPIIH